MMDDDDGDDDEADDDDDDAGDDTSYNIGDDHDAVDDTGDDTGEMDPPTFPIHSSKGALHPVCTSCERQYSVSLRRA